MSFMHQSFINCDVRQKYFFNGIFIQTMLINTLLRRNMLWRLLRLLSGAGWLGSVLLGSLGTLVGWVGTLTSSVSSLFPVCCYWKVWKPEIRGELGGKSVNPQDHSALQWLKSFLLCQTSKTFINQPGGMGWFCEKEKAKCAKRSSCFPHIFWSKCKICPIGIRVFSAPFCLAVGVSRTDSSTDTSRVASSVDVSEGHDGGEVAEGVVGAASSGDTSRVHCCFPLANVVGKLTLVSNLGSPPKNIYWNWKSTQLTLRGGNVGAI